MHIMKVYLVQHGQALPKSDNAERPLSNVGHGEVGEIAEFLTGHMTVSRVVHSGKRRAHQTAVILTALIAGEFPVEEMAGLGPNDPVEDFAKKLVEWDEDVLVVGHLPFMEKLASYLITGSAKVSVISFTPGSVVCLELSEDSIWQLQWMVRPELIRESD